MTGVQTCALPILLELVDRIIVLDEGRVVADGPKGEVLNALYRSKPKLERGA